MIKIATALQPFLVPNFVLEVPRRRPRQEGTGHCLHELSEQALSDLCDQFRASVFAKAGKADPAPPKPREGE